VARSKNKGVNNLQALRCITIEPGLVQRLKDASLWAKKLEEAPSPKLKDYRKGKRHLHLDIKRGNLFHLCASLDPKYICCSTHVTAHVSNCPFECTYCFLQNYLTDTTLTLVADTDAILREIRSQIAKEPWRLFRIGTWELGDSLGNALICKSAIELIEGFSNFPNALLKLRTKGALVEPLLNVEHKGRTVISWSVNPQEVVVREEIGTASVQKRISAMKKAAQAGFLIGLHFDPMLLFEGWENGYKDLVHQIFAALKPSEVCWISIGSLRFNPEMKKKIETNYPRSRITSQEMVLGDDNKFRYVRHVRVRMYRHLLNCLTEVGADGCLLYLCMERPNVWKALFNQPPKSIGELDFMFAHSMYRRFPKLDFPKPSLEAYLKAAEPLYEKRN